MLTHIHISNLITIENLDLDFRTGTTSITGETGTGKSILIDAIELALGGRASDSIIRPGQDKADISLTFDTHTLKEAHNWLSERELGQDNRECVIRRTINKDGKSRSYINGVPTTLQPLRELSELLITIHGQHENQSLLRPDYQRDLLDHYAGHIELIDGVHCLATTHRKLKKELQDLQARASEHNARIDFLTFQLREFQELNLDPNEFGKLDIEHKQLANSDELIQHINQALHILSEQEEQNIITLLNQAIQSLETIQRFDPRISPWIAQLNSALISLNDTEKDLQHYLQSIDIDPERLNWLENRISMLFNLARKHKVSPNELYEFQEKLIAELNQLENSDEHLATLTKQLSSLEADYENTAKKLSQSRLTHAKKLATDITQTIRGLALPHAAFDIQFEKDASTQFSQHGLEKIIFHIKTNPDQPAQPLAKIASGGELSRVSLAIHIATAEQHTIPTLIFDEVDVGISGSTAEIVGKLLRKLGETHQVLCITHLAQVASLGHHHLCVKKVTSGNSTSTQIAFLEASERVDEIARILGGVDITKTTLAHAKEMVERAC